MSTTMELSFRRYGVHTRMKEIVIGADVVTSADDDEPSVDEDALLGALPVGFLPCDPRSVLLVVSTGVHSDTAVGEPKRFRSWGKYFDSYSLTVTSDELRKLREEKGVGDV